MAKVRRRRGVSFSALSPAELAKAQGGGDEASSIRMDREERAKKGWITRRSKAFGSKKATSGGKGG